MNLDKPLKIIHLDDGREWRGGQHQVALLAEGLATRGIAQLVLCPPGSPLGERLRKGGVEILEVDYQGEMDRKGARAIADASREFAADIIHAHTAHAHAIGLRALQIAKKSSEGEPPVFLVTRRVDFEIGRNFFSRRKYRHPDVNYIAISEGVCSVLCKGGVAAGRIDVVHSGVPPIPADMRRPRGDVRSAFKIGKDDIAIVNVGALTDHKGQRYLIEAFASVAMRFPNARLWILGDGELRETLESQVTEIGLADRIQMPGFVPDARALLSGFDLYVSSSHLEGLGTSIIDAMLAGLPVVAAAAGGVTDIVLPGSTGRLAPPRNAEALAAEMIAQLEAPEVPRQAIIDEARRFAEVNFSADSMVEGTLRVYRKLISQPRSE